MLCIVFIFISFTMLFLDLYHSPVYVYLFFMCQPLGIPEKNLVAYPIGTNLRVSHVVDKD